MLTINTTRRDACVVVHVEGRLDGANSPQLTAALEELALSGQKFVVVDLARVPYISSAGLRTLINGAKRLRSRRGGGEMHLAAAGDRVIEVLELAGLLPVLRVYPTSDEAVASLTTQGEELHDSLSHRTETL